GGGGARDLSEVRGRASANGQDAGTHAPRPPAAAVGWSRDVTARDVLLIESGAGLADRDGTPRRGGVALQLAARPDYVRVAGATPDRTAMPPDLPQQIHAGDDGATSAQQGQEEGEFPVGNGNGRTCPAD